ncbi:MAG: riboflavin synthase [Eubacteriales bacterium]|nr:riboflavin synthase [Eubacteriales bacterium]
MFTGIIEETGFVKNVVSGHDSGEIRIGAKRVLEGTLVGDSIAVNGVCLTVTRLHADGFMADVMPVTLRRSNLGKLVTGSPVNLERAMAAGGRFGGHIVSGHIDGVGYIRETHKEGNAVWVTIGAPQEILRLIVEKGSIAIDGISLTVARLSKDSFSVSIIPHTGEETILLRKKPGDPVNLENDIVGKYVERLLGLNVSREAEDNRQEKQNKGITLEFLRENGF